MLLIQVKGMPALAGVAPFKSNDQGYLYKGGPHIACLTVDLANQLLLVLLGRSFTVRAIF